MHPVKINTVIIRGFNDTEVMDFARLVYEYPLHIRFIEFMPIGDLHFWKEQRKISVDEVKSRLNLNINWKQADYKGNGPAQYYNLVGAGFHRLYYSYEQTISGIM